MTTVRLIGDLHGEWDYYKDHLLEGASHSIQVGDFGMGFNPARDALIKKWQTSNLNHKFIRGNHDHNLSCATSKNFIEDGYYDKKHGAMFIGGAWSIDYFLRKEGSSWWNDEENSQEAFNKFEATYLEVLPRVMITHDAPHGVPEKLGLLNPQFGGPITTRTGYRLARMFLKHKPQLWVFGHWHKSADQIVDETRFVCLGVSEARDLNWETLEIL